jgi:hypothetical protein
MLKNWSIMVPGKCIGQLSLQLGGEQGGGESARARKTEMAK